MSVFLFAKKMANKILLRHKGDVGDYYEPSDSENEYNEREKQLLKKVRKGRQRNTDPEQEILAFDQRDDSEEYGLFKNAILFFEILNKNIFQKKMMKLTKNLRRTVT